MPKPRSVLLASLLAARDLEATGWRYPRLSLEGFALTVAAMLISHRFTAHQGGIISVFLTAAALRGRLEEVLEGYLGMLMLRGRASRSSAWRLAASLGAVLLGVMAGYALSAVVLGPDRVEQLFGFTLQVARLGGGTLVNGSQPNLSELFVSHACVVFTLFALSFIYRIYGVALALVLHACIFSVVLTLLVRGSLGAAGSTPLSAQTAVAGLPHLLLEGVAYLFTAMAAISLSHRVPNVSGIGDPSLHRELRRTGKVLGLAAALLLCAVLLQARFPLP